MRKPIHQRRYLMKMLLSVVSATIHMTRGTGVQLRMDVIGTCVPRVEMVHSRVVMENVIQASGSVTRMMIVMMDMMRRIVRWKYIRMRHYIVVEGRKKTKEQRANYA